MIDNTPFAEEIVQANKEDAQDDEVGKKPDEILVDQAMHIDKKGLLFAFSGRSNFCIL